MEAILVSRKGRGEPNDNIVLKVCEGNKWGKEVIYSQDLFVDCQWKCMVQSFVLLELSFKSNFF